MKQAPWLLAEIGTLEAGAAVVLDAAESRHAAGSLRLAPGRDVVLTDGAGAVADGTLSLLRRGRAEVNVVSVRVEAPPVVNRTLGVGVLAGSAMDLVVQKAVELGIGRLVPVCCQRSQLGIRRSATRIDHWTRLARQALKQCRRPWALEVAPPLLLADFIDFAEPGAGVVAHPGGRSPAAFGILPDWTLLVGPEGGFAEDEEKLLEERGWPRLRLGPHVLRAETAAIAGMAVLSTRCDDETGVHSNDG